VRSGTQSCPEKLYYNVGKMSRGRGYKEEREKEEKNRE
jgi:hypothetical protein